MQAGPVSSGMVSGTTAMLARAEAMLSSSSLVLASAGWAFSMARAAVSNNNPPPTWKLASEIPKNFKISKPMSAQVAITTKLLKEAIQIVCLRWARLKSWV